tara:strand:+ start:53 stop:778 length:726 start_codon:yes stop_codon:yes gene_type:complete
MAKNIFIKKKLSSKKNNSLGVVLFMGRAKCMHSKKIKYFLKKKSKKLYYFESKKIGEMIDKKLLKINYDYIFCFRSYYILKKNILKKVKVSAINFHPGIPNYRGIGAVNYAIYNNSEFFGSTAHIINEKIDNGEIIDVKKFRISKKSSINEILNKTYEIMTKQAISIIKNIYMNFNFIDNKIKKNITIKWSNKIGTLKDLEKFYILKKNIQKKDLLRKIRATNTVKFKPYINLHGKRFILE